MYVKKTILIPATATEKEEQIKRYTHIAMASTWPTRTHNIIIWTR